MLPAVLECCASLPPKSSKFFQFEEAALCGSFSTSRKKQTNKRGDQLPPSKELPSLKREPMCSRIICIDEHTVSRMLSESSLLGRVTHKTIQLYTERGRTGAPPTAGTVFRTHSQIRRISKRQRKSRSEMILVLLQFVICPRLGVEPVSHRGTVAVP
jgi:hypothetical protein